MILDLEIDDKIFEKIEALAKERGISTKELIRWALGDYTLYNQTHIAALPLHSLPGPSPYQDSINRMTKLAERMFKTTINQGAFKCPNCTLPLTIEDLEEGKCSKCQTEI